LYFAWFFLEIISVSSPLLFPHGISRQKKKKKLHQTRLSNLPGQTLRPVIYTKINANASHDDRVKILWLNQGQSPCFHITAASKDSKI